MPAQFHLIKKTKKCGHICSDFGIPGCCTMYEAVSAHGKKVAVCSLIRNAGIKDLNDAEQAIWKKKKLGTLSSMQCSTKGIF